MSSNLGEQSLVPASMVQDILERQRQALETIGEQNKVNQVTQQQNTVLLQRIDTLQQHIHNYKQDERNLDAIEIKGNNQSIPATRGPTSNDTLFIKDSNDPLHQSPDTLLEIERRHKKALEDLDNEWRDKYDQLRTKYDVQYKAYQELKAHYQKRSAEWKCVKKWLDEQNFVQKSPERAEQTNKLTSKPTKTKGQFEKSSTIIHQRDSPFSNDLKTNSSAFADITNMPNNNRSSHNVLSSPDLLLSSDKAQTNFCSDSNFICDQEWNEDHIELNNSDHDMAAEVYNMEKNGKDSHHPSKRNRNTRSHNDTTPELVIDLEERNYEFPFDDSSLKRKRSMDKENIENDELSSTEVTNKRCKPLTSKPKSKSRGEFDEFDDEFNETFISDDDTTKTPDNNRLRLNSRRLQASTDNTPDDNDIENANILTSTASSIKNKGTEKESNNKNNNSKQGEGFRYIETVRKRSEKRQSMTQNCRDCRKHYEMTGISLPCHNQSSAHGKKQLNGKHRVKYSRPQTPPGFWKVGFPTSPVAEINELSVAYERGREEHKRKET